MISGKGAHAKLGMTNIDGCYSWTFRMQTVELDNATAASEGYENPEGGLIGGTFTIRGWYDVGVSAFTSFIVGDIAADVHGFLTFAETTGSSPPVAIEPAVKIPFGLITEAEIGAEVRGKIDFSATIKTRGPFEINEAAV